MLTDTGLAHFAEYVAQALHALPNSARMVDEPIDGLRRLICVDIECRVIDVRKERRALRRQREVVRKLLLPLLRAGEYEAHKVYDRLGNAPHRSRSPGRK